MDIENLAKQTYLTSVAEQQVSDFVRDSRKKKKSSNALLKRNSALMMRLGAIFVNILSRNATASGILTTRLD
jgi:hypothetical protein